jgi:2-polyprenyl-3-methyl-5-hydroxy-6-metoxy-1,4-benzoquinol methylase
MDFRLYYKLKDYQIFQCTNCGLIFTPAKEVDLPSLYSQEYYEDLQQNYFVQTREDYAKAKLDPKLKNFYEGLELLKSHNKSGKILDVGCAQGMFLDMARAAGWEPYGVDVSKYASAYAREKLKLNVVTGDLIEAHLPDKFFDVVTLWDTAEHIPNPVQILQECRRILKDDGLLYLVTIDEDSLMPKLAHYMYRLSGGLIKRPVALVHPIHHVTHFSKKTLLYTMEKSGYKINWMGRGEVPLSTLRWKGIVKAGIWFIYFLAKLLNKQYEVSILASKSQ